MCVISVVEIDATPHGLVSHIKIQMYLRQTANGVYKMIGHVPECLCVCVALNGCESAPVVVCYLSVWA